MKTLLASFVLISSLLPARPDAVVFKSGPAPFSFIEIYASEGCSSCPPAEEWLSGLTKSPELWKTVFPAGFHVDYWDYLGWPDRFASPAFSIRQREAANRLGQDSVYTPEFIVNGREWRDWGGSPPVVKPAGALIVTLDKTGSGVAGEYSPTAGADTKRLRLNVAFLGFHLVSNVTAGENRGRRLVHDFVVLGFGSAPLTARVDGGFAATVEVRLLAGSAPGAITAWVSDEDGMILQVAGGPFPSAASTRADADSTPRSYPISAR